MVVAPQLAKGRGCLRSLVVGAGAVLDGHGERTRGGKAPSRRVLARRRAQELGDHRLILGLHGEDDVAVVPSLEEKYSCPSSTTGSVYGGTVLASKPWNSLTSSAIEMAENPLSTSRFPDRESISRRSVTKFPSPRLATA